MDIWVVRIKNYGDDGSDFSLFLTKEGAYEEYKALLPDNAYYVDNFETCGEFCDTATDNETQEPLFFIEVFKTKAT
jgi:hypothetical protein